MATKPDPVPMDIDSSDMDDDPITASYPVFLNPALPLGRRLLVLQHPNHSDEAARSAPTELRLKAESGMVEVDVPLDYNKAYDKDKGLKWGRTLQQSMTTKNGGSHGLAGGFGFGAVQQRGAAGRRSRTDGVDDDDLMDWNEAVRQDKILRTQTLGGQYPETDEVQYMVGVFQGKDLHLTPVSTLVHLRPQLHHLDATTQLERQATASSAGKEGLPNGSSSTGQPGSSAAGPRAIHMTIKTTADGETTTTETIADRLRSVQSEPWRKMKYTDENEEAAWEVYNESLFLTNPEEAATVTEEDDKGKAVAVEKDLSEHVPSFSATWEEQRHLEAVSGFKKPEKVVVVPDEEKGKEPVKEEEKKPAPAPTTTTTTTRRRGGAAVGTRRGGRKSSTA